MQNILGIPDDYLFASMEKNGKVMEIYGFVSPEDLKELMEKFQTGQEIVHPQVKVRPACSL